MKKIALVLALQVIALGGLSQAQLVTNVNNISFWVGSGTNWSVLVLDFKDGGPKQAFAWGYRYNDPAPSGASMLFAIAAADPNLNLVYSGNAKTNLFLTRIDYFDGNTMHSRVNGDFVVDERYWGYQVTGGTVYDFTEGEIDLDATGPAGSAPAVPKPQATIQTTTDRAVISVPTEPGFTYRLTYSGSPGGPWTNEPTALSATNIGPAAFTNFFPHGTTQRFYRLLVSR
jgi:hypothetical protein